MRIFGGIYKNRELKSVKGLLTRPSTGQLREALFNILQNRIVGAHFLDLFAGSGAVGFEAISRGASAVTFVENHRQAFSCLQENRDRLGCTNQCQILSQDVMKAIDLLERKKQVFDIIFADPPYLKGFGEKILKRLVHSPLLKSDGLFYLEESSTFKIDQVGGFKLLSHRLFGVSSLWEFKPKELQKSDS